MKKPKARQTASTVSTAGWENSTPHPDWQALAPSTDWSTASSSAQKNKAIQTPIPSKELKTAPVDPEPIPEPMKISEPPTMTHEKLCRKMRNLRKTMREVDDLIEKKRNGGALNSEQEAKISRKDQLQSQCDALVVEIEKSQPQSLTFVNEDKSPCASLESETIVAERVVAASELVEGLLSESCTITGKQVFEQRVDAVSQDRSSETLESRAQSLPIDSTTINPITVAAPPPASAASPQPPQLLSPAIETVSSAVLPPARAFPPQPSAPPAAQASHAPIPKKQSGVEPPAKSPAVERGPSAAQPKADPRPPVPASAPPPPAASKAAAAPQPPRGPAPTPSAPVTVVAAAARVPEWNSRAPASWRTGRFGFVCAEGHARAVASVFVVAGGARVISAGYDCLAREWEGATGRMLREVGWHQGPVLAAAGDNGRSVTGGADGWLVAWCPRSGRREARLYCFSPIHRVALLPDPVDGGGGTAVAWAVTGHGDGSLRLYDVTAGGVGGDVSTATAARTLRGHTGAVEALSLFRIARPVAGGTNSGGGGKAGAGWGAVSAGSDGVVLVRDLESGAVLHRITTAVSPAAAAAGTAASLRAAPTASLMAAEWLAARRLLVTAHSDGSVRVCEPPPGLSTVLVCVCARAFCVRALACVCAYMCL